MRRQCTRCREWKDESAFALDKRRTEGFSSWCRSCHNEDMTERRSKESKETKRYRLMLEKYGLSREATDALSKMCDICGSTKKLCVDHDHVFGHTRGVLCYNCNVALGHFKDDITILEAAIKYLKER